MSDYDKEAERLGLPWQISEGHLNDVVQNRDGVFLFDAGIDFDTIMTTAQLAFVVRVVNGYFPARKLLEEARAAVMLGSAWPENDGLGEDYVNAHDLEDSVQRELTICTVSRTSAVRRVVSEHVSSRITEWLDGKGES